MKSFLYGARRFLRDEEGANGVEYAMLAGLIAIAFVAGATFLGANLNNYLNIIGSCVASAPSAGSCPTP